jgi:hypothetical protein
MEVIAITDKIGKSAPRKKEGGQGTGAKKGGQAAGAPSAARPNLEGRPTRAARAGVRDRRDRAGHLRQAGAEGRQPPPLGGLGERHRQDRPHPHRPHHRHPRKPGEQKSARPSTPSPSRAARRPERQHHRGRDHRDAGPAPDDQAGVRRAVRGAQLRQREPDVPAMQGVLDVLHEHHLDKEPTRCRPSTTA